MAHQDNSAGLVWSVFEGLLLGKLKDFDQSGISFVLIMYQASDKTDTNEEGKLVNKSKILFSVLVELQFLEFHEVIFPHIPVEVYLASKTVMPE